MKPFEMKEEQTPAVESHGHRVRRTSRSGAAGKRVFSVCRLPAAKQVALDHRASKATPSAARCSQYSRFFPRSEAEGVASLATDW